MDYNILTEVITEPAASASVVLGVIWYLRRQSRDNFFRIWLIGWGFYLLFYLLIAWRYLVHDAPWKNLASHLALSAVVYCVFLASRSFKRTIYWNWRYAFIPAILILWSIFCVAVIDSKRWVPWDSPHFSELEIAPAAVLTYAAYRYLQLAKENRSQGLYWLGSAVGLWAVLVLVRPVALSIPDEIADYSHFLGPLLQMVMGIALVTLLFEQERRTAQENLLAFSTLETNFEELVTPAQLAASMQRLLNRLLVLGGTKHAAIFIVDQWRNVLPHAQSGFASQFLVELEKEGLSSAVLGDMRQRKDMRHRTDSGDSVRWLADTSRLKEYQNQLTEIAQRHSSTPLAAVTALALRSSERTFGLVLFGHEKRKRLALLQLSLLKSLARQLGTTLDHYVQLHEARRRSKEYKLLTQIGQAVSSRLNTDDIMRTIHRELGKIFDTSSFYIAFRENDEIRFEFETENGKVLPKRSRKVTNGVTEHIIATGEPLLIQSDMEKRRSELGLTTVGPKAKCFCGVPLFLHGKPAGMMAALSYEREFAYDERDLELLRTAAGQVSISVENARTFQREQQRARDLAFLNNVSRIAISSKDPAEMLAEIAGEMHKTFKFDHISIGFLDYTTKELIIKAEAGDSKYRVGVGRRVSLDDGLIGLVAHSNQPSVVQEQAKTSNLGLFAESRAVMCHPITYGETLLGILNVERFTSSSFAEEEVLILGTLGDLLATALQNVFSFQKMEHQSITDSLTGLKTRRYFLEALQSEWKRASRSGRPFSVVMIDLDRFKHVNDAKGHLEGDLVLARVGRLLEQKVRHSNVVARYGGDEFVVLMPETGLEQAQILAERLRVWIAGDLMLSQCQITGSFGVASFPLHGARVEEILSLADEGMYLSKHAGGDRVSNVQSGEESDDTRNRRHLISSHLEAFLTAEANGHRSPELLKNALAQLSGQIPAKSRRSVMMDALRLVCRSLEASEDNALGHGDLVARHCESIGRALELSPEELLDLVFAAQIHDVGKIAIPVSILNKAGLLTPEEYAIVKNHPTVGADLAAVIPDSERIQAFVRYHQERFDGSGYPSGLHGEQIPIGARIIAVAEAFAWVSAERSHGAAKSPDAALTLLKNARGVLFDRKVVDLLLKSIQQEGKIAASV
jgi:diguanylate cyclase (GGDEF)-like protein